LKKLRKKQRISQKEKKSMKKCQTNATTVIKWKETDKTKNEFLIYTFFWHERVQNINLIYNTLFFERRKKNMISVFLCK